LYCLACRALSTGVVIWLGESSYIMGKLLNTSMAFPTALAPFSIGAMRFGSKIGLDGPVEASRGSIGTGFQVLPPSIENTFCPVCGLVAMVAPAGTPPVGGGVVPFVLSNAEADNPRN